MMFNSASFLSSSHCRGGLFLVIPALIWFCGSCSTEFTPNTPFTEQLVVYAVLDASTSIQSIRIESSYDAGSLNETSQIIKKSIDSAVVSVSTGGSVYHFHDTLITFTNGVRKKIWVSNAFHPKQQAAYHLSIKVPGFQELASDITIPYRPYVQMVQRTAQPDSNNVVAYAGSTVVSPVKQAYYFRLWITGQKEVNGSKIELRYEAPTRYEPKSGLPIFTTPSAANSVVYPVANLERLRDKLIKQDSALGPNLIAISYAMDMNMYTYYKLVHGFQDPLSVQLNAPNFTNITNGLGIFGAVYPDSIRLGYTDVVFHTTR